MCIQLVIETKSFTYHLKPISALIIYFLVAFIMKSNASLIVVFMDKINMLHKSSY